MKLEAVADEPSTTLSSPQPVLSPQEVKAEPQSLPTLHLLEAPTSSSSYAASGRPLHHRTTAFKLFPCTNNNNPSASNNNSTNQ